jgi:C_GCAxxG_C_C family probable redox protein
MSNKHDASCAGEVVRRVGEKTGISTGSLKRLSVVLDGGVGLAGGVCGALSGAIVAVNSRFGMDVRSSNFALNVRDFIIGHMNLLLKKPMRMPEPFGLGREIVMEFSMEAGSINCSEILGKRFRDPADFETSFSESGRCRELIDFASNISCRIIESWK